MLANIEALLPLFGAYYQDIIVCWVIMVSAIIVAIGLLKPILFNKIKNQYIRKATLAFSNVASCFISAFVTFLIKGLNFEYFLVSALALSASCIITYWLYENTCLRNLIGTIGKIALKKIANMLFVAVNSDDVNELKTEVNKVAEELKSKVHEELKKATNETEEDNDLRGL